MQHRTQVDYSSSFNRYRRTLRRLKFAQLSVKLTLFGILLLPVFFLILFFWYAKDLPVPDQVKRREGFSTIILDRTNKPIYDLYNEKNRIPVAFSDIPDSLKKATVAIEDKDFYKHKGFDPKGIVRALFYMVTLRGMQGGSTLTQQLVKNVLLTSERSVSRKIKEFILALQIERKYTKDEILQMYLNEAPYGGTMWGIESASEGYFGKHAKDLSLAESVILSGLPQRPSYYSPFSSSKSYVSRSEEVLRRMREDGYISDLQELELKKEIVNIKFASASANMHATHFVLFIKKFLIDHFGEEKVDAGGLKVTTTLDLALQEKAEAIVSEELEKLKGLKVNNGAVFAVNPSTGEILAYVGSRDYDSEDPKVQGKFDVVTMGFRQPGSALKPITYASGFTKGYTPSTILMDVETKFLGGENKKDYIPKNYDNKFHGPVQIRFALGNSINIPAVKMTALVGIPDILKTAYDMGISTLEPTDDNVRRLGLSLTLGGGEVSLYDLVSAYGVLATGGVKNESYAVTKVEDASGQTIYSNKQRNGRRVLAEDVSFLISNILSDNDARKDVFGEKSYLVIPGKTVAVKTGTTDDKRDNWTIGYTPSLAVGVWVGNNDNSPMDAKLASGVTGAAPIWNRIIREGLKDKENQEFRMPDSVTSLEIDAYGGGIPHEGKPTRKEYFIRGTEPTAIAPIYKKIKLSKKDNGKLANSVEIATGAYDEKEFIVFTESDPTAGDGENRWQKGIDEWLKTQSDSSFHPPSETSNSDENQVIVKIRKPEDMKEIDDTNITVEAEAKAIRDIKKMEILVDDSVKSSVSNNRIQETITFSQGIHKIKVRAFDDKDHMGESEIKIGVKVSPYEPTPTLFVPTPTSLPTPMFTPTPTS